MPRTKKSAAGPATHAPDGWAGYYRVIRRIPRGRVATYGAIAELAGRPRSARHVGFALAALRSASHGIPWQRVMGARGRGFAAISLRDPVGAAIQRDLLEVEGVAFDEGGRIDLARFGWSRCARSPRARAR
ncbi:MAG: MGMT family protein [Deltaproteobacteria bacterium]